MKKTILIFLCSILIMLTGCQNTDDSAGSTGLQPSPEVAGSMPANTDDPTESGKVQPSTGAAGNQTADIDLSGFQKEMNIVSPLRLRSVCKTENGYYLQNEGLLYFMDVATGQMIVVCGKPECSHNDVDCNAWINSSFISYYEGKLYYRNADVISDSIWTLWSMNLDGTGHTMLQRLQSESITDPTFLRYSYQPILVNGFIYYIERNTMLYKARVGADISTAVLLIDEDTSGKLESTWKFWADNGNIYAMNNFLSSSGEYQDVLYLLGESEADTKEIWNSSQLQAVSVSYWYITGGKLYYYISGSDLWTVDLSIGKTEKILKLSDRIRNGQALFTDANVIILDSDSRTIAIYSRNGDPQGEISLSPVYEAYSDIYSCDLVFADGGCMYLLAYHGVWMSPSSSLYQIDWEGKTVRELDTWPARAVTFQQSDHEYTMTIGG